MNAILLSAAAPVGDDFTTLAYGLLIAVVLVAAIATWVVTPKAKKH